jgi:hypothetical protein
MNKSTWMLAASGVIAVTVGGPYLLIQHQAVEQIPSEMQHAPIPQTSAPKQSDRALTQRKLDGIGSTRELKPIPITEGDAR